MMQISIIILRFLLLEIKVVVIVICGVIKDHNKALFYS